jgi:hypothetical protein
VISLLYPLYPPRLKNLIKKLQAENKLNAFPLQEMDRMFIRSFFVIGIAACALVYQKYNQADLYIAACIGTGLFSAWAVIQYSYKNLILYTLGEVKSGWISGPVTHGYRGHLSGPAVYFFYTYKDSTGVQVRKLFLILKRYLRNTTVFTEGQGLSVLVDPKNHKRATVFIEEAGVLYNLAEQRTEIK